MAKKKKKHEKRECRLCGQMERLIYSHIIPKWVADHSREICGKSGPEQITKNWYKTNPGKGAAQYMLCQKCENLFGDWEAAAKPFVLQHDGVFEQVPGQPRLRNFSHELYWDLKRFLLSVLWRAHVAVHHSYEYFELEPDFFDLIDAALKLEWRIKYENQSLDHDPCIANELMLPTLVFHDDFYVIDRDSGEPVNFMEATVDPPIGVGDEVVECYRLSLFGITFEQLTRTYGTSEVKRLGERGARHVFMTHYGSAVPPGVSLGRHNVLVTRTTKDNPAESARSFDRLLRLWKSRLEWGEPPTPEGREYQRRKEAFEKSDLCKR